MSNKTNTVENIQENASTQTNANVNTNDANTNNASINDDVAGATPNFVQDKEYTFSMRSFRVRNGFTFASVMFNGDKIDILIGSSNDYKFGDLLQAKSMQANLYATYKSSVNVNGVDYPRFWDIGIG